MCSAGGCACLQCTDWAYRLPRGDRTRYLGEGGGPSGEQHRIGVQFLQSSYGDQVVLGCRKGRLEKSASPSATIGSTSPVTSTPTRSPRRRFRFVACCSAIASPALASSTSARGADCSRWPREIGRASCREWDGFS